MSEMPKMSTSECQVFRCLWGNRLQNFQFESPKIKLREFVRVPTVSDSQICSSNLKRISDTIAFVGLLFIFGHLSCVHLATLKIHSVSQTSLHFEQRTLPEVVNNSGNEAISLVRIPFLLA